MNEQQKTSNKIRERATSFFARQAHLCTFALFSILSCSFALAALSSAGSANISPAASAIPSTAGGHSHTNAKPKEDRDLSGTSSEQHRAFLFEHHHCDNCHTMGTDRKLGFNERVKDVGKGF